MLNYTAFNYGESFAEEGIWAYNFLVCKFCSGNSPLRIGAGAHTRRWLPLARYTIVKCV